MARRISQNFANFKLPQFLLILSRSSAMVYNMLQYQRSCSKTHHRFLMAEVYQIFQLQLIGFSTKNIVFEHNRVLMCKKSILDCVYITVKRNVLELWLEEAPKQEVWDGPR
jgi:transcriptional regulator NrdR family protein